MSQVIQCDCGKFKAELTSFPKNTPGRCICYCDDCQNYLHFLGRTDLLDSHGGTEIIPVYPSEYKIIAGTEVLRCVRLSPRGLFRFSTKCCNTPLGNMRPGFPWIGNNSAVFTSADKAVLGPIKSRIQAKFAKGTPPPGASRKLAFKDILIVLPFVLKGKIFGKGQSSPFFPDGKTPIVAPELAPRA